MSNYEEKQDDESAGSDTENLPALIDENRRKMNTSISAITTLLVMMNAYLDFCLIMQGPTLGMNRLSLI